METDTCKPTIPEWIPERPLSPLGFHWEYRGKHWKQNSVKHGYIFISEKCSTPHDFCGPSMPGVDANGCSFHYFELVENKKTDSITIKVAKWSDWKKETVEKIKSMVIEGKIDMEYVLIAPRMDPDDLKPFYNHFFLDGIFDDGVFVEHPKSKDAYWFMGNDCPLIYKPKTV